MKHFAMFALVAGLAACGQNPEGSDVSNQPSKKSTASLYSFSVDQRPVDGNYESITVKKERSGTYRADFRVITSGFGSPSSDTTQELGTALECFESRSGRTLLKLKCSVDMRPADGELVELTLARNPEGLYNAILRKATYATLTGPATDVTKTIASGLTYNR